MMIYGGLWQLMESKISPMEAKNKKKTAFIMQHRDSYEIL